MTRVPLPPAVRRHPWAFAFALAFLGVAALKLGGLGVSPPGLYSDEASIGYNAWAIAHHGVDEHGNAFPVMYFQAFGEYKNPLYIYLLAPLTWFLPLTAATVRLPAALCGIGVCALVAAAVWTLTRDRASALLALLVAGVTPWLALESRVAFEVPTMTLTLSAAILLYVRGMREGASLLWLAGCGTALGLTVYAYTTGRLYAGMLTAYIIVDCLVRRRSRGLAVLLAPIVAAYVVLAAYAHEHPGALTARYEALSIGSDHPGVVTEAVRFVRNYFTYDGVPFLFTNGDGNLRHSTGYGGVLLVTTLPLLALGVVRCVRAWREPASRLLLAGLVAAPVPAALTADGTPHALRSAAMLPFVLVLIGLGWAELLPHLTRQRLIAGAVAVAVAADAGGFAWDLFVRYPGRAVAFFDTGEVAVIQEGHSLAGSHTLYVSDAIDVDRAAYIQALFALTPAPPSQPVDDRSRPELAALGVVVLPSVVDIVSEAEPGDIMVLGASEVEPQGATLLDTEEVTLQPASVGLPESVTGSDPNGHYVLAKVWRR